MNVTNTEETLRSLFNGLKRDKVESLLVHHSDWGINIRMFLNGDMFEEIPPMQIDKLSKLTQLLQLC